MYKKILLLVVFTLVANLIWVNPAMPQTKGNQPNFVLLRAFSVSATPNTIDVFFGDKFPVDPNAPANTKTPYMATSGPFAPSKWIVRAINLQTHTFDRAQSQINSVNVLTFGRQVALNMQNPVDTTTFSYVIIYAEANTPIVTLNQPEKSGPKRTFTAAKGKNDADIYFSGEAAAARNSKPAYSIESKFGYLYRMIGAIRETKWDALPSLGITARWDLRGLSIPPRILRSIPIA